MMTIIRMKNYPFILYVDSADVHKIIKKLVTIDNDCNIFYAFHIRQKLMSYFATQNCKRRVFTDIFLFLYIEKE